MMLLFKCPSSGITSQSKFMSKEHSSKDTLMQAFSSLPGAHHNLVSTLRGHCLWITINRARKLNAFALDMYSKLTGFVREGNINKEVKYMIITGAGGNFSTGNDLSSFSTALATGLTMDEVSKISVEIMTELNEVLINSEKPIFAITEGKVIGFAFTILALFDRVFAAENSEFNAPLVKLAQGPEMCSSYTFPRLFGDKMAEELLVKGIQVDSLFLAKYDFVVPCRSRTDAEQHLMRHIEELDALDWKSYLSTRRLFKAQHRNQLLETGARELENLHQRWTDPELPAKIFEYMNRQKRAKL